MPKPILSVLMANYNHARYLPLSLGAIVKQLDETIEVIVVDDGSTDESVEILQDFAESNSNFHFLKNDRNRGTLYSVERALGSSSGEYLYFCSADDQILPELFKKTISLLLEFPEAGACTSPVRIMNEAGDDEGIFRPFLVSKKECFISPTEAADIFYREGTWFMGPTAVYRKKAFLEAGGFNSEHGPMADDFLFMLLALKHGVCYLPEPLAIWRRMAGTYSAKMALNLEKTQEIIAFGAHLMRTVYREYFPERVVSRWEGRCLFGVNMNLWIATNSSPKLLSQIKKIFVLPYLFLRFRPWDVFRVIGRQFS